LARLRSHTLLSHEHGWVLLLALLFGALACAIQGEAGKRYAHVPPQEWQKERGPVVPHDSFPRDCSLCHAGSSWNEIKADFHFDHVVETGVRLEGAHADAECLRCHNDRGPVAQFAQQGCSGCHEDLHRGKLGKNCADCHAQTDWGPNEIIASHSRTRFPLVGSHAATACFRCHPGSDVGNFDRTPIECVECHADQIAQATAPDHVAQGLTNNCDRCHIPTTWTGAGFNHGAFFPLTGQHASTSCKQCHVNNVFAGTPTTCVGCHQADYDATRSPNHALTGLPTTCAVCHNTSSWTRANFRHQGVTNGCVNCHQADYQSARDPNHVLLNFPTNCEACHHSTSTWKGAEFSHRGITSGCVACHQDDYNATRRPNHVGAGFPTSCQTCHNTASWKGATFNHVQFPITSGRHSRLSCQDCHQVPSNYGVFTCISCHEHSASEMNHEHDRVRGYTYNSNACYNCHPDGKRKD
jgi:hypothetical protein